MVIDQCPHCGVRHVKCRLLWESGIEGKPQQHWATFVCQNDKCKQLILLHTNDNHSAVIAQYPGGKYSLDSTAPIPQVIRDEFREAGTDLGNNCFLSSMTMSRRVIQRCLKIHGHNQHNLVEQIDAAKANGDIPKRYHQLADEIRLYGNIGAHPDDGKDHLVSRENGEQLLAFVELLVEEFFTLPAKAAALTAARKTPKPAN